MCWAFTGSFSFTLQSNLSNNCTVLYSKLCYEFKHKHLNQMVLMIQVSRLLTSSGV